MLTLATALTVALAPFQLDSPTVSRVVYAGPVPIRYGAGRGSAWGSDDLAPLVGTARAQQTDTTIPVRPGTRLEVNNYGGEIVVRTWAQNAVRIRATHSSRDHIEVSLAGSVLSVKAEGRRGMPQLVEYEITAPAAMALKLWGVYTDIAVEGTRGDITAETVEGEITVRGGNGLIALQSVEGSVTVENARGRVDVHSVDGDLLLRGVSADISAEAVDGDIVLERIEASNVDASTVDGDIRYEGTLKDGGRYRLATHDGEIDLAVPEGVNATVSVATFGGDFESTFPVTFKEKTKRRFKFVLGSGSATLELQSFDGSILLRRPGERARRADRERETHDKKHDREDR